MLLKNIVCDDWTIVSQTKQNGKMKLRISISFEKTLTESRKIFLKIEKND